MNNRKIINICVNPLQGRARIYTTKQINFKLNYAFLLSEVQRFFLFFSSISLAYSVWHKKIIQKEKNEIEIVNFWLK